MQPAPRLQTQFIRFFSGKFNFPSSTPTACLFAAPARAFTQNIPAAVMKTLTKGNHQNFSRGDAAKIAILAIKNACLSLF
jgi:hypothetical protein